MAFTLAFPSASIGAFPHGYIIWMHNAEFSGRHCRSSEMTGFARFNFD